MSCAALRDLIGHASAGFAARFGAAPTIAGIGPGRVNIIGEHVDYAGGVVVPFAIDRWCVAAAGASEARGAGTPSWRVAALDLGEVWEAPGGVPLRGVTVARGSWQAYVVGVLTLAQDVFARRGVAMKPMSIAITSNVPRGSGLSSSAALCVSVAKAVEGVIGAALFDDGLELARLCQRAENEFAGVPCGLMDHAASVLGREGEAIVLACREPEAFAYVRVPEGLAWFVVESGVSRSLAAGKYAKLREASDEAAKVMGVRWLWDASLERVEAFAQEMSVAARRAAEHAVGERGRVERALAACACGNVDGLKRELNAAHESLRGVLGVSCPELDAIVASAQRQGAGARLVGAGFGGCALVAVEEARAEAVMAGVRGDFEREFGRACPVWRVAASDGARIERG